MSTGPIGFNTRPDQTEPESEYGGASGLIQPDPHDLTPSESNSAMTRAALANGTPISDDVVDPVTGRVVPVTTQIPYRSD